MLSLDALRKWNSATLSAELHTAGLSSCLPIRYPATGCLLISIDSPTLRRVRSESLTVRLSLTQFFSDSQWLCQRNSLTSKLKKNQQNADFYRRRRVYTLLGATVKGKRLNSELWPRVEKFLLKHLLVEQPNLVSGQVVWRDVVYKKKNLLVGYQSPCVYLSCHFQTHRASSESVIAGKRKREKSTAEQSIWLSQFSCELHSLKWFRQN